jgi:hypothetical protein
LSYVRECQIKRLFHNIASLNIYLMQYANKSLLENEKCTQFIQCFEKKIQISKMIVLHLYLNQIKLKIFQI